MIKVEIIADSRTEQNHRITSWVLTYPRFIHSEFLTHRMFSRNAASSRAIPVEKMVKAIMEEPAMPEYWGANQKGMQASTCLSADDEVLAKNLWKTARTDAVNWCNGLLGMGVHKQLANRIIEPWAHMTVIMTATEMDNFFALRAHPAAQPEFQVLAYRMLDAYLKSEAHEIPFRSYHIPFSDRMPAELSEQQKLKVATARCARVSYLTFEGEINVEKDYELHDRLAESGHWSPFEHCAMAIDTNIKYDCGNFKGWLPYRKNFPNENVVKVDLHEIMAKKPQWVTL